MSPEVGLSRTVLSEGRVPARSWTPRLCWYHGRRAGPEFSSLGLSCTLDTVWRFLVQKLALLWFRLFTAGRPESRDLFLCLSSNSSAVIVVLSQNNTFPFAQANNHNCSKSRPPSVRPKWSPWVLFCLCIFLQRKIISLLLEMHHCS